MASKLKNGLIPAGTECPFKDECNSSLCKHQGVWHTVNFSCAFARGFDLIHRKDGEEAQLMRSNVEVQGREAALAPRSVPLERPVGREE